MGASVAGEDGFFVPPTKGMSQAQVRLETIQIGNVCSHLNRSRRKKADAVRLPCDILMYLSYSNSYSRQAVWTVHVLYCKLNRSSYLFIFEALQMVTIPLVECGLHQHF